MPTIEKLKECGVYCSIDGQKMIVDGTQEKKPVDMVVATHFCKGNFKG